jgi:hypothetical protein
MFDMRDGMLHLGRSIVVRFAIPWLVPLEALAANP